MDDKAKNEEVAHPLADASSKQMFIEDGNLKNIDTSVEAAVYAAQYKEHLFKRMEGQLYQCEWAHLRIERAEEKRSLLVHC